MTPSGLTRVRGIRCGHFTDTRRPTGCTVVLAVDGAVGGVDVRGAAPGTRETELLSPLNTVEQVHAVLLAGGSAFGLDAAGGVMRWLDERGIGAQVGALKVPIVPAAILFDLLAGDSTIRPDAAAGYAACEAASDAPPAEGNLGAGAGAAVGKLFGYVRAMKGGVGSASLTVGDVTVGALVAVNAMGDVIDPANGRVIAGARSANGRALVNTTQVILRGEPLAAVPPGAATTLGVIATDARLTKSQANKLAQMGHDGLARTISPVHTSADGDTLFALATGASDTSIDLTVLGTMAAEVVAVAVLRAVQAAESLPTLPAARDFTSS
ncbi:MAG TPA: P1 family peptidase [Albitalea sp.]|uniref:P1 family peptidase n=1 Tax=Piscinibacter sp. TaxID=1903157 RepID=UPI002ED127EC